MLAVPSRHRSLILLGCVVLAQVLLLAVQIRNQENVRLIRVWAVWMVTPVQQAGTYLLDSIAAAWGGYVSLRDTRGENQRLRAELDEMRLRVAQLEGRAAEAGRLAALLEFREGHPQMSMLAARIISGDLASANRTVYLDRGSNDGVARDMGVITPQGVVGKVLEVFGNTCQVLLITDRKSGVGSLLTSTRTLGVAKGTGGPDLLLDHVVNDETVAVGEDVVTSGLDRIFPKDLPVGTVTVTEPGSPFKVIRLQPAAEINRLEEVLILLTAPEKLPGQEAATAKAAAAGKPAGTPQE